MLVFQNSIWIDGTKAGRWQHGQFALTRARAGCGLYEGAILALLHRIDQNAAGHALLSAIGQLQRHKVLIVQYGGGLGYDNAAATVLDTRAATPQGEAVRDEHGRVDAAHAEIGIGWGTDSIVSFSPRVFSHHIHGACHADEVLHHELTHALRDVQGHLLTRGMGESYPNQEEFFAVLTTNIYISAKHAHLPLRGGYDHPTDLLDTAARNRGSVYGDGVVTESQSFVQHHLAEVDRLYDEERPYASEVARVNCTYNPFRDYAHDYTARSLFSRHMDSEWH